MNDTIRDASSAPGTAPIGNRAIAIQGVAGATPIAVTTGTATPNASTFAVNKKNVAAAGTAEQLQTQIVNPGNSVLVRAKKANTGIIQVGPTKLIAENAAEAFPLSAGESISLEVINVDAIWIDATVSAEGVEWIVEVT